LCYIYWDDVGVPGWELRVSWSTKTTMGSKNCKNTAETHSVFHGMYVATETGWQMRAGVLLRAPAQERGT
jgi:hypothetical protein